MPLLDHQHIEELLLLAKMHRPCGECGQHAAQDYCRSCDEFYWIHAPGCTRYEPNFGHRLTLVPFVELRDAGQQYVVCPKCGRVSYNPTDILERYCGACHGFHDELMQRRER